MKCTKDERNWFQHRRRVRGVIVAGEPGTGKTTQVPQWCAEYAHQKAITNQPKLVACTQTRRAAAVSIATRVADEMDVQVEFSFSYFQSKHGAELPGKLGQELGYSIRFEDCTSAKTVLKYCTDALLKELINKRNDIKIVILSATHTGGKILRHFEDYRTITIRPRAFPINIIFKEEPVENFLEAAIRAAVKIHISEDVGGDILLFLTDKEEIEEACKRIRSDLAKIDQPAGTLDCIPLYAGLSKQEVQRIFKPEPSNQPGATGRRCIIATDIAETSLIIDGIVFVIDPGFVKQKVYNPSDRTETPSVRLISKANAILRAYHAGRSASGKCYRLYTYETYQRMGEHPSPEIQRSDLSSVVLYLKKLAMKCFYDLDFMDFPYSTAEDQAVQLLKSLGALDNDGQVTELGSMMAQFPIHPQLAKALITSAELNCSNEILSVAAMLSAPQCFLRPTGKEEEADAAKARFAHIHGDPLALLNVYNAFIQSEWFILMMFSDNATEQWCSENFINYYAMKSAENIRTQLGRIMDKVGTCDVLSRSGMV
ncbi:helicase associated domain protein [Cooperia oncophora]